MSNTKKSIYIIASVLVLVAILGGVTYAWFNYRNTTSEQQLIAGDIYLRLNEGQDEIELSNIFPETAEEARARDDNYITFEVTGKNTSNKTVYYEIILNHGETLSSPKSRYNDEDLRFDLVEIDGNTETYLLLAASYETLVNRRIYVNTINANTSTEVEKHYLLRMWLDENVIISDTAPDKTYTSAEYPNEYATIKLSVAGDFSEKEASRSLYTIMRETAVMDNVASTYVTSSSGINFGAVSSDTNGKGVYTRAGTENDTYPIMYYRGAVEDNNVLFNNICWKAVRTTDTGGVKLIYNGDNAGTVDEPICDNTGEASQITLNDSHYFSFSGNSLYLSPVYNGYMWGTVYNTIGSPWTNNVLFGNKFTWDGEKYQLTGYTTTNTPGASYHYSCNAISASATCTQLRYVFNNSGGRIFITLTGGDGIEQAFDNMRENTTSSNAKTKIDAWYLEKMTGVSSKLEDTIWCNDRSFGDGNNNGWIANGGSLSTYLCYGAKERSNRAENTSTKKNQPSLACTSKSDGFTVNNSKGNMNLIYPVALLTEDETVFAGGIAESYSTFYLKTGKNWWTLSPYSFRSTNGSEFIVDQYGGISSADVDSSASIGLRPSISLKHGIQVVGGSGTASDPYVIE